MCQMFNLKGQRFRSLSKCRIFPGNNAYLQDSPGMRYQAQRLARQCKVDSHLCWHWVDIFFILAKLCI